MPGAEESGGPMADDDPGLPTAEWELLTQSWYCGLWQFLHELFATSRHPSPAMAFEWGVL
jgi:hypothetical protein